MIRSWLSDALVRDEPLAQLAEHLTFNQGVGGSIPPRLTILPSALSANLSPPETSRSTLLPLVREDAVGTVLLGNPQGLEALTAFLRKIGLASPEIEIAQRVLAEQWHYEFPDVKLSPAILRQLGEPGTPR